MDMLARVTTWEGGNADGLRSAVEELRSNVKEGPPPGVKSKGFSVLVDQESGRTLMIGLFENEQDLQDSEAALKAMDPPSGIGTMAGREVYEVGVDVRM